MMAGVLEQTSTVALHALGQSDLVSVPISHAAKLDMQRRERREEAQVAVATDMSVGEGFVTGDALPSAMKTFKAAAVRPRPLRKAATRSSCVCH